MTPSIHAVHQFIKECPLDKKNCVSTVNHTKYHGMSPLIYKGTAPAGISLIKSIILSFDRTEIVEENERYIHSVFTSKVFRFKDDVEFFVDEAEQKIHYRSASRKGYSDFGVNRNRINEFLKKWDERKES